MPTTKTKTRARPHKLDPRKQVVWNLSLHVPGQTPKSNRGYVNLEVLCEEHLKGLPLPLRTIIGDLSDSVRLLGLDLRKVD